VALAVLAGAITVVQSRVNGAMGEIVGNGLLVGLLSFGIGTTTTVILVAMIPSLRRGLARMLAALRSGRDERTGMTLHWWHLIGGMGGALFVVSQGISVPLIGVAIFTVSAVAAQNANSLVVDRIGLGPAGSQPVTRIRVIAACVATIGVVVSVGDQIGSPDLNVGGLILALVAGAGVAAQQAVNGRVAVAARTSWVAAMMNFCAGFAAICLVVALQHFLTSTELPSPTDWFQPWMVTGGLMGIVVIVIAAMTVKELGVLVFALSTIAGQMIAALLLAWLFPVSGQAVSWWLLGGVVLTGGAAGVATVAKDAKATP
ncbi:MAG: DMT family transporter, partial [Actinobacteria bacterium]|nr:DMT family transporter [Actinomycetota bacterium]